ncbi:hypothetical protein J7F02_16450 [Streptomyces sp. ISL-112]|uniref:hypothetical protein n=1 Tax=unclassified Streptomyces TaxID=2593676 RepID=UPI001BE61B5D|nr:MULTISPECIES: hypothetical protein [unclassified Streptomyces]MBT2427217.1 hypothetical protein [Streptomyces sp. ISL-112]MBT2465761.1 hypothetical protein [Streptomyces sp. ISL-63]
MSNEQQPRDDDQDTTRSVSRIAEPTLAEFREFLLDAAQENPAPGFWRSAFQDSFTRVFVETIDTYLESTGNTTGGYDPDEPAPLTRDYLANLARAHRSASPRGGAALDGLLDQIAYDLDLYDVRIMRGAWAGITEAMPRIALAARERGKSPDEIAQATGYTSSRIAQFIRQEKQRRAAVPLARYSWRVEVMDTDGEWTDREHGEGDLDPDDLPSEANRLIDESGAPTGRARIFLWEGENERPDADAAHTVDRTRH